MENFLQFMKDAATVKQNGELTFKFKVINGQYEEILNREEIHEDVKMSTKRAEW